jgi:hypothetical protein
MVDDYSVDLGYPYDGGFIGLSFYSVKSFYP